MSPPTKTTRHRDSGFLRQMKTWRDEIRREIETEAKARKETEERLKAAEAEIQALKKECDRRITRLASRVHRMEGEIWNLPAAIPLLKTEEDY